MVRLLEYAARSDPDFACFLHLGATSGARRGELLALRWTDLDLDLGTLTISRSVIESSSGVVLTKDTKTHASRMIALDADTLDALVLHRKRAEERAAACGVSLDRDALVFSSEPDGSRPWTPSVVTRRFMRLRDGGGFKGLRLHDLRHFAATRLLAAGVPVRTVSGRLGHSNAATTLGVYAHFVEESDRDAAVTLGSLLAKERGSGVRR